MSLLIPAHDGAGLADLAAELERRLTGASPGTGLAPDLARLLPEAASYVLVVFDGLGHGQLSHPQATTLASSVSAKLHAPFPTTTTVALATLVTASVPSEHGVIGHLMWLPGPDRVVNVLKWREMLGGKPVSYDVDGFLPSPNLWERLAAAGREGVTVQPADFRDTPLSRVLYRGAEFEGVHDLDEMIEATVTHARTPGRLILTYLPHVDVAAHVGGQRSAQYGVAVGLADRVWMQLRHRMPPGAALIGTADHGHVDYPDDAKLAVREPHHDRLVAFGDPRSVYLRGDDHDLTDVVETTGAAPHEVATLRRWWGPTDRPHPELSLRAPDLALLAPPGRVLLPKGFDTRLVGYHGGLEPAEVEVPLLIG